MKRADTSMHNIIQAIIILLVIVILLAIFLRPGGLLNRSGQNAIDTATQTQVGQSGGALVGGTAAPEKQIVENFAKIFRDPMNRPCMATYAPSVVTDDLRLEALQSDDGILVLLRSTDKSSKSEVKADLQIPAPAHMCALYGDVGPSGFIAKHLLGQKDVLGFVTYSQQMDLVPSVINSWVSDRQKSGFPFLMDVSVKAGKFDWWSEGDRLFVFYPAPDDHLASSSQSQKEHTACLLSIGSITRREQFLNAITTPFKPGPSDDYFLNDCAPYKGAISSKCKTQMDEYLRQHECRFEAKP